MVRRSPVLVLACLVPLLLQCDGGGADAPRHFVLHVPAGLAEGTRLAAGDLADDLARVASLAPIESDELPAPCVPGELRIAILGHEHAPDGQQRASALARQAYRIVETRCGDGRLVTLEGGSLQSAQWAVYDLAQLLGIRYFHPEQTFYPEALEWPAAPLEVRASPSVIDRSMHVHRTHPVELVPPLQRDPEIDMAAHQRRWIDWNVKMRQTRVDGWDAALVGDYAYVRGFPRSAGINLLNAQQGQRPVIDPEDPRPEREQIAAAIDAALAPVPGLPPARHLGFQFNPSEFTEADPDATIERLRLVTEHVRTHHPGVEVSTINHGTHQAPLPGHGVRFFDLSQYAPDDLGVAVHPLMFYDLERPAAGVYGNQDFRHLLEWIEREQARRRIVHYPEGSWWLTFDLPVPLFLAPVTLEAREHDLALLAPHLSRTDDARTGVHGHRLFTSGQEWGYWLIDYCVAQMVWDVELGYRGCLADVTGRLARGDALLAVLDDVTARQVDELRDPEIVRFLVGSDDETEAAADVGVVLHPLPPAPADVLGWDDGATAALETRSLGPLRDMAAAYHRDADRVEEILAAQSEAQAPWVREIRDGLRVFALRAEHAVAVYETVVSLRAALRAGDADRVRAAARGVERARALTAHARRIVRARERDYRYPLALSIAGAEPGADGAIDNGTIYPYRVLSRTHRMFYWERPDRQLAALFDGGLETVRVNRRVLERGTPLEVAVLGAPEARIEWGAAGEQRRGSFVYRADGAYRWRASADPVDHVDQAYVVSQRLVFPRGSVEVVEPAGAALVSGLLPGLVVGLGDDGAPFMVLGRIDGTRAVAARGALWRRGRTGNRSGPADLSIELRKVGALTVFDAAIEIHGSGDGHVLTITGALSTDEVVERLVGAGGFDEPGARTMVARALGYRLGALPARVPFRARATGRAEP